MNEVEAPYGKFVVCNELITHVLVKTKLDIVSASLSNNQSVNMPFDPIKSSDLDMTAQKLKEAIVSNFLARILDT